MLKQCGPHFPQVLFMQQAIKGMRQEFLPLPHEDTPADGEQVQALHQSVCDV
jgi:hypothetical protein